MVTQNFDKKGMLLAASNQSQRAVSHETMMSATYSKEDRWHSSLVQKHTSKIEQCCKKKLMNATVNASNNLVI